MDKKFVYLQNKKICINTVNSWDAKKKNKKQVSCRMETDVLIFQIKNAQKVNDKIILVIFDKV